MRQPRLLERAGKAEAVQQAEGEGHHPGIGLRKPSFARFDLDELARHEGDAERDRGFDGLLRQAEIAESGACQRDAVCDREGGDRLCQHPEVTDQQHQRQHEQQMIEARENVIDPQQQIGLRDLQRALGAHNEDGRGIRGDPCNFRGAVAVLNSRQRVRHA